MPQNNSENTFGNKNTYQILVQVLFSITFKLFPKLFIKQLTRFIWLISPYTPWNIKKTEGYKKGR